MIVYKKSDVVCNLMSKTLNERNQQKTFYLWIFSYLQDCLGLSCFNAYAYLLPLMHSLIKYHHVYVSVVSLTITTLFVSKWLATEC
jgi:hypothetical protein